MTIDGTIQKIKELAKQKIEQKATENPFPPWYDFFTEGEELIGEIVEIRENTIFDDDEEEGEKKYFYHVKDPSGTVWTLKNHKVLSTGLKKAKVGDILYIKYVGKIKSEKVKLNYFNYDIAVMKPNELSGLVQPQKPIQVDKPTDELTGADKKIFDLIEQVMNSKGGRKCHLSVIAGYLEASGLKVEDKKILEILKTTGYTVDKSNLVSGGSK